ncbi:ATP-binding cassette domain-containing protein [Xanthovirga aplysinae]|uniref:ATP-binding cassette domain-containing protein n=1 Tax=Xanthovirga aplysinae TaxID=2529853 RepID=UPI0012BCC949|nr:ATP-binding cassette domain-containing protein [Xanthovirga aplysinae]MTI32884.1 ATP-binding cassette domain-containing protein [Xanthovirga aplysinae]
MVKNKHWAIYTTDLFDSRRFSHEISRRVLEEYFPELIDKKGELFSNAILDQLIEEESRHEIFELTEKEIRGIRTYSSGEQKKALLEYLLAKNPDFIILDSPFDNLDKQSQEELKQNLKDLAERLSIIQVLKRKSDMLPFINEVIQIKNDEITFFGSREKFLQQGAGEENFFFKGIIPSPENACEEIPNPLIKFTNVSVKYEDRQIVRGINWEVKNGEFWHLIGPNGSGKTTLLSLLTGDNPKAYGQDLMLFSRKKGSGESVWEVKKNIGYFTPSMTQLFRGRHTLKQMVISGFMDSIGLYQRPSTFQKQLANQWIELCGFSHLKSQPFVKLSKGHQCVTMIIRAMVKHPPLLILDEPSTGLDDYHASMVVALINKIAKESATSIIYVSHRSEPKLKPEFTYELIPGGYGSTGRAHDHRKNLINEM